MTEQEAIETLEDLQRVLTHYRHISKELTEANGIAIKALEEIQKYRAMEKRLEAIYGDCPGLLEIVVEHLERHDGIGIDKPAFKARLLTDDNVDKWDSYKEIGTVEECRAAVDKQKEKEAIGNIKVEPIIDENGAYIDAETFCYLVCPCCGNQVGIDEELDNYCSNC